MVGNVTMETKVYRQCTLQNFLFITPHNKPDDEGRSVSETLVLNSAMTWLIKE
jgi:hypothetical protein